MTVRQRLSFSAQLANCNVGPCWHVRAHNYWCMLVFSFLHLLFIGTIASVVLSSSWYQVLWFENSPWAGFGQILAVACATMGKHSCPVSTIAYFRWKSFLGKPVHQTNFDWRLNKTSFAAALGGACALGTNTIALIQICQIQAIMTVPQRLSFSAQLSNCNLATWVAAKTSVNSWDHPTFEISLRFLNFLGFVDRGVSLWNSSSGIFGFLVCDQNWEKHRKNRVLGIALASHDQR